MKYFIALLFFFPYISNAQNKFVNLDFDKQDSIEKKVITWNYIYNFSEISIDSTISFSGKNSLDIISRNRNWKEGCTIYFSIPKTYYNGLKHIQVSIKIRFPNDYQNGGFWIFAYKNDKIIDGASTFPNALPFPVILNNHIYRGEKLKISAWAWNNFNISINLDKDPDDVIMGFHVKNNHVWFDDIQITLNDKPINDLVFKISK